MHLSRNHTYNVILPRMRMLLALRSNLLIRPEIQVYLALSTPLPFFLFLSIDHCITNRTAASVESNHNMDKENYEQAGSR